MSEKEHPFEFFKLSDIEIVKVTEHILTFERHTHIENFTCSVITSGNAILTLDDEAVSLFEGSCFTVLPNCPHSITSDAQVSMISLCVGINLLKNCNSDSEYKARIGEILNSAEVICNEADLIFNAACDIYELYCYTNSAEAARNTKINPYYSKYHYMRLFKKSLGLPPHKYRLQRRIREAQKLLTEGYSSTQAATQEEFYDQSHFIKCFKTVVGVTPSEYKASIRNFLLFK